MGAVNDSRRNLQGYYREVSDALETSLACQKHGKAELKNRVLARFPYFNMKFSALLPFALALFFMLIAGATERLLTADPLTGLPLHMATDSRLNLGNSPTRLPESLVCNSKIEADFYIVYNAKVDSVLSWYSSRLPDFKRTHAYVSGRSQDTFYAADGSLAVSVTGSAGKSGENTETYSLLYSRFQPALAEKTIIGLNQQKVICP